MPYRKVKDRCKPNEQHQVKYNERGVLQDKNAADHCAEEIGRHDAFQDRQPGKFAAQVIAFGEAVLDGLDVEFWCTYKR